MPKRSSNSFATVVRVLVVSEVKLKQTHSQLQASLCKKIARARVCNRVRACDCVCARVFSPNVTDEVGQVCETKEWDTVRGSL